MVIVGFHLCPVHHLRDYGKVENGSTVFTGKAVYWPPVHCFEPCHLQNSSLQWPLELYCLFISLPRMVILLSAIFLNCSMGHDIVPNKYQMNWNIVNLFPGPQNHFSIFFFFLNYTLLSPLFLKVPIIMFLVSPSFIKQKAKRKIFVYKFSF